MLYEIDQNYQLLCINNKRKFYEMLLIFVKHKLLEYVERKSPIQICIVS